MTYKYKLADIDKAADIVLQKIHPGAILALSGQLASGKTTLTKAILAKMGYTGRVNSPTFVLEKNYPVDYEGIKEVVHLDFYRLNDDQIQSFGWREYLDRDDVLMIIEWPERLLASKTSPSGGRVTNLLPKEAINIKITEISDDERQLDF